MTVLDMPARPGLDAAALPRRVPWRRMIWVTWRQHRALLVSVLAVFAVAVVALPVAGQRIRRDYALLTGCRPAASPACQQLSNYFNSTDWHEGSGIRVAVLAAPLLLALFAGPPVVARELENGTFRYAWTQGIGRARWTAAKLALLGAALTIGALVISLVFTWFFAPFLAGKNLTALDPAVFDTRAPAYAAWTLTAFCLGAFLGTLLRRVTAAMAVTLPVFVALGALGWFYLLGTHGTFWLNQGFEAACLLAFSAALVLGTLQLVRRYAA
jgi:ABC-2 family transporter protein